MPQAYRLDYFGSIFKPPTEDCRHSSREKKVNKVVSGAQKNQNRKMTEQHVLDS